MQIVIDIPEIYYEALKEADVIISGQRSGKTLMYDICSIIANGTPLPKGHGDLIDTKDILYEDLECVDGNTYMVVHAPCIDNAKVIVTADKGDEE